MKKIALYPGCSLEGTAQSYMTSLAAVLQALGREVEELKDWNCCGATSAHALDHDLYLGLATKNLALAEAQGFEEVLAPCAACYHRLASAQSEMTRDESLRAEVNAKSDLAYNGTVKVRNVLDFLARNIGPDKIKKTVKHPLAGKKVACYYGCLNTRIPRMKSFDDPAYPMTMDRVAEALGAKAIEWGYKTECCGASLFVTSEPTALRLSAKIIKDAVVRGADCLVVACPMCHNNLDTKQADIVREHGIERGLPVLFITQLMGLAFGIEPSRLRLADHFVSASSLEGAAT